VSVSAQHHTSKPQDTAPTSKPNMKTPVLIVLIASVVVLLTLPAAYLFLAYHTHRERDKWRTDYDRQVKNIEAQERSNPRPASTTTSRELYSVTPIAGRAPPAHNNQPHHHKQQSQALARPAPVHNPPTARPHRELNLSASSRTLAHAHAAPEGIAGSARPAPGSRASVGSSSPERRQRRRRE
jgi:hypothetical protein